MIRYSMKNVHDQKLDQWIKLGMNTLLVGEHGTGKTQRVLEAFERNKLKYVYFSGATLDPWLHLIGVPEVSEKQSKEAGRKCIEFILPENIDNELEAIFMDEYNRSHKVVRNALLELQQFKSINGRKFPKLKLVWAAINPPKEEDDIGFQYDVDEPDPAQVDRFHAIVEIPSIPDPKYFKKRFGDHVGGILIKWWKKQADDAKVAVSPRRLEYAGNYFFQGAELSDILPPVCNVGDLVQALGEREEDIILKKILADPNGEEARNFLREPKNFYKVQDEMKKPEFFPAYVHVTDEIKAATYDASEEFKRFVLATAASKSEWTEKIVKDVNQIPQLEAVRAVLSEDWPDIYISEPINLGNCGIKMSSAEGNVKEELAEFELAVKNGNYNVPAEFYLGVINDFPSKSYANTYWHKRAWYWLRNCHSLMPAHLIVNIVLSVYNSLQKQTIDAFNGFDKLFNRMFLEGFNRLSPADREKAIRLFEQTGDKHADYNKIKELISKARGTDFVGALPKEVDTLVKSAISVV